MLRSRRGRIARMNDLGKTVHSCNKTHPSWDRSLEPALEVLPGDTFDLLAPDASNGMLKPASTVEDIESIDFNSLDPLCGPVYVKGAQPGDTLKVQVLNINLGDWGWTGLMKGFGLLASEFPEPFYRSFDLSGSPSVDIFGAGFDLKPMVGALGLAPAESGSFPSIVPTKAAGNIDVRYLNEGAILYLPVFNEGALLSGSDGHALQGEGEISGTAIETPMALTLQVDLIRNTSQPAPMLDISTKQFTETEYRDFLGIGPDLFVAAQDAVRYAVDFLASELKIEPFEAYAMMGIVGELRIHEIVDQPNWVVGCMLPKRLFGNKG